jgi:hypothetical protein
MYAAWAARAPILRSSRNLMLLLAAAALAYLTPTTASVRGALVLVLLPPMMSMALRRGAFEIGALVFVTAPIARARMGSSPSALVTVTVRNGHAELLGMIETQAQREALGVLVRGVAGVDSVSDHLVLRPSITAAV